MPAPLKRSMVGYEVEMFTLDNAGNIIDGADLLLAEYNKTKPDYELKKEVSKSIVELAAFPHVYVQNVALGFLTCLEDLVECASRLDITLYPLSTYPGKYRATMRQDPRYRVKQEILGPTSEIEGKCTAYHVHYTMPRGVFDHRKKQLRLLTNSKLKQALINSYNMAIAMDPAITALMQSSPFFDGKHLGKDSRLVVYRGTPFGYKGMYSEFPKFGSMPNYRSTATDLIATINNTHKRWIDLILDSKHPEAIKNYPNPLMCYWGPVRLNKLGTLEHRGMDANHPKYMIAVSILMKYILRDIHREFYRVIPSDIGIKEPFKLEGDKIYIPPISRVKYKLQKQSALKGFDSPEIYDYCDRFIKLGLKCMSPKYKKTVSPILRMLKRKATVSDTLIKRAKKKGYSLSEPLPQEFSAELALKSSSTLLTELDKTRLRVQDLVDE